MSLLDKTLNAITGSNIKTIKVDAKQLASIINEAFILKTSSRAERDAIEKTIKGGGLLPSELDSIDHLFHLYVGGFHQGLTKHRTVWVQNFVTEEVYEWSGFSLGEIKKEVSAYLVQASIH